MQQIKTQHPEWSKNKTLYEVNIRQYTPEGTFKAFEEHLPRIQDMGVGIIWFMPIQPIGQLNRKGTLGSYYSIRDYTAINEAFGTLNEFKELVKKIHEMGMYVILDWVANHTAWDHVWTVSHPEFYTKDQNGGFKSPIPEWSDVIDLDFGNRELRMQMIEAMKFWLQEADIDGFRCDMAHLVPTDLWNEVRPELDKVKQVFMLAESELRDLLVSAFDMIYNWRFYHTMNGIAHGEKNVHDLDQLLQNDIYNFPENAFQMFFTSNHDENSWNGSAIERLGIGLETYNVLIFTIAGLPLIYNGQEAGETKRLSFFEKDEITWKEDKLMPFYKKLIALKKRNSALWAGNFGGTFTRIDTSNNWAVLSFVRERDEDAVLVILNFSHYDQNVTLYGDVYTGIYSDVFSGEQVSFYESSSIFLRPWDYRVYEKNI